MAPHPNPLFPLEVSLRGRRAPFALCCLILSLWLIAPIRALATSTAQEITQEATAPNSETNHPLPLMATWAVSNVWDAVGSNLGYTPAWQMDMIASGHHLLPTFMLPFPGEQVDDPSVPWSTYYHDAVQAAATLNLPMAFSGTQWEQDLYFNLQYYDLPAAQNPNVLAPGVIEGTTLGTPRRVTVGSGYSVGDVLTIVGGTYQTPAQLTVTAVDASSNNSIAAVSLSNAGSYSVLPTSPVAVTGGTGTGATFHMSDGIVRWDLSPLGPIAPWQSVGTTWGSTAMIQQLQSLYPNPPLVVLLSNNEAVKLDWYNAQNDQHYLSLYGTGTTDAFKRKVFGDAWIDRYRGLQSAWRNAMTSTAWKNNSKFVGYEAFADKSFARWDGWPWFSLYSPNRIGPYPLMWDGGSPSYYLMNNDPGRDDIVFSPQVEAMNYDFMLKEAYQLNPNFWFELSTWSGCDYWPVPQSGTACSDLRTNIPNFTPERFGGMVQFGMWLTRPRVVRHYSADTSYRSDSQPYFDAQMAAVDRVYTNPVLTSFWRTGQLVANTSRPHPYYRSVPTEYASVNRMFMLTTSADPPSPWYDQLNLALPVFALARMTGIAPQRQWLVYAFAPGGTISGVQIAIPDYGAIAADATVAGAFYLVDEASATVNALGNGDTGSGGCSYGITPGSSSVGSTGGSGSVSVATGQNCAWMAVSNAGWIAIGTGTSSASGTGSNGVAYSVARNGGPARTGTMTIAGLTYTVNQDAATCAYTLSATSASIAAAGGTGTFGVAAASGCGWTATSNASWITVTSGASGSANGTVGYSVAANSGAARTGTITAAGQTFTVSQAAAAVSCAVSLKPTGANLSPNASSNIVQVTTGATCPWTAKSNTSWITITSGSSGTGSGTVAYAVAANAGAARNGSLTIGGQTFTVSQRKAPK